MIYIKLLLIPSSILINSVLESCHIANDITSKVAFFMIWVIICKPNITSSLIFKYYISPYTIFK